MPDKPKRRKNNKNKRKNKQNRPDLNKFNNADDNETGTSETCSVHSELLEDCGSTEIRQETNSLENNANKTVLLSDNVLGNEQSAEQNCNNNENSNEDLNNNSENTTSNNCTPSDNVEPIQISENYIVESPQEQSHSKNKRRNKFKNEIKSKSLDNDDEPKIEEILDSQDENTMEVIDSNVLVSDVESDIEWEKIDEDPKVYTEELATGTISITTIPLNLAQCEQPKALTSDKEKSLRHYLQTLDLSTNPKVNSIDIKTEIEQIINHEIRHRLSKKGLAEEFITAKLGSPRILDVIDEESSESSMTSRRQSYLSDMKSDNDDLDDDVFEEPKTKPPLAMKPNVTRKLKPLGRLVPQECVLVGTKLKEADVTEARGDWTVQTVEKMKGAEVVYLTDSSSSTSSIHELSEETENGEDTDGTIRMLTPTIEVTDTDSLLKKTYVADNKDELQAISQTIDNLKENLVSVSESQQNDIKLGTDSENTEIDLSSHEIVVSSTDNIKTNLYVKDIENINPSEDNSVITKSYESTDNITDENKISHHYNIEIKALRSELNDAMTNLIKEVCSDSENNDNSKDNFVRHDSSSSIGSSQCTAKYNPTQSSLNDVSNMHDETFEDSTSSKLNITSHVKDVFQCVTGLSTQSNGSHDYKVKHPAALRDICVGKIASLPYGEKILEELASVSERLQHINKHIIATDKTAIYAKEKLSENMPYYPLPDISSIEKISLTTKPKEPHPPPRNSSLKQPQDDHHWTGIPTKTEPVYVCLSPSQKMLMEKTNTVLTKEDASQLVNMHKKFVDRRGYNEPSNVTMYNEFERSDPPIVPFKSQTGSRLLALIRNPSVNMNSVTNNFSYSSDQIKSHDDKKKYSNYTQSLKPIPPPRPNKYSSSFYESDESSDFTDNSLRSLKSERKFFHYSTGNLSKDIENDISSIQNMHRYYKSVRENSTDDKKPRRPSLPKDLCDQQMEYIKQKEKEVEAEIKRLERKNDNNALLEKRGPRAPVISEKELFTEKRTESNNYMHQYNTKNLPFQSEKRSDSKLSSLFSSSQEELLRDKMYSEYVTQMAQRQERKQHKIIKITNPSRTTNPNSVSRSMSALDILDSKVNNRIEKEFISKARERWNKLGITDPDTEDERDKENGLYREPKVIEHKIKVIEGGEEKDVQKLPSHLQDFVNFTAKQKEHGQSSSGESGAPASPHVVVWCAVIVAVFAVVRYLLRMLRNM